MWNIKQMSSIWRANAPTLSIISGKMYMKLDLTIFLLSPVVIQTGDQGHWNLHKALEFKADCISIKFERNTFINVWTSLDLFTVAPEQNWAYWNGATIFSLKCLCTVLNFTMICQNLHEQMKPTGFVFHCTVLVICIQDLKKKKRHAI